MNFRKKSRQRRTSTNFMVDYMQGKWRTRGNTVRRSIDEPDDNEEEETAEEITDWAEELFGKRTQSADTTNDQDVEVQLTKKQTLILSTLVPDEILLMEKCNVGEPSRFVGVLMMADVSGYTALSERYTNTGKGGTYRLTATLNAYLGALIELIYSHGGDIIKFAGDAFLALWKTDKKTFLCHTIHSVIVCALVIQHSYARYETDVKVNLRVKLAISAGNLMFSTIGTGSDMNYVIFGLPVLEAKLAESVCASGEVKLTPAAWAHCYSRNYDHIIHKDGHVTIKSILYDTHDTDVNKPFQGFAALLRQAKKPQSSSDNLLDHWNSNEKSTAEIAKKHDALSLRKAILVAEANNKGAQIRNFMIRPVLTQIDAHQPLEYLTEMRDVSVLFVTLKPTECPPLQLITIVNNSYQITCEIVYKSMGCVNKIILFDKDVMILVIFGLRGYKHESEAQAALKCASSVKRSISALDGVLEVSIGVTTGQVYCGVVGHPLRREFTVIGTVVNKAARLMCSFRNKVTCDEMTFVKSKMSNNGFTLQPHVDLKGIGQPGKIFEYTEEIRVKELYNIPIIPPILNRVDELDYIECWLEQSGLSYRDFDALLLIGESRIGKSRMLEWLLRLSCYRGHNVCFLTLTSIHSANPYLALSQIFNKILGLEEPVTDFKKEQKLVDVLKIYDEDLCHLNNIIKVRFAYHESVYSLNEEKRKEKAKHIFKKVIDAITDMHVILLDDLQNLDPFSWDFISVMLESPKFFTIFTVTRGKFSSVHSWLYNVFINSSIRKIVLGPLESCWIAPLACQILDVKAVPVELCNVLKSHCKGMPGLVESFIIHLFSNGAIELKNIKDNELAEYKTEEFLFPDIEFLKPHALDSTHQEALNKLIEDNDTGDITICVVAAKDELIKINLNEHSLDALIMIQIDALTPYQQLLLKIASVIGSVISRDLLENIMYENNSITTAKAVKRLFAMRIFTCANSKFKWSRKKGQSFGSTYSGNIAMDLDCDCNFEYDPENEENLPKYAFCKEMRFRNKNSQKTCYELLPLNQKREFHTRILNYLETNRQKCPDCGGTLRILQSRNFLPEAETAAISAAPIDETVETFTVEKKSDEEPTSTKSETLIKRGTTVSLFKNVSQSYLLGRKSKDIERNSILKTDDDTCLRRRSTKRVTMLGSASSFRENKLSFDETSTFGMFRKIMEIRDISEWHDIGVADSVDNIEQDKAKDQKTFAVNIEKGVSQTNFKNCTCYELNILVYDQLINHALQAELKTKAIECSLHYCYLNLLADNTDTALAKLQDTKALCRGESTHSAYDLRRFMGRIYALEAACLLFNGKMMAAKRDLEKAARYYGIKLKKSSHFLKIKNIFKFKSGTYKTRERALQIDALFCLNVGTTLFTALGDQKVSRTCAYYAIEIIKRVDCRVVDICDAITNALLLELERGSPESSAEIEKVAKHIFHHMSQPIKAEELFALGKLYMAIFRTRTACANLPSAIRAGFRAIVVSHFYHAYYVTLEIIPDMFYLLLCRRRVEEAIDVVKLCLTMSSSKESYVCETWYYALCMDLILDAGLQLESPDEVNRYAEFSLQRQVGGKARRRLVVNLWTYWLRMDVEKQAKRYETEALSWISREDDDATLTSLFSALRLTEGLLESLARKMDDLRKVVDLMELRSIADTELTALERDCRVMRVIYCRWIRLRASSLSLSGRHAASTATYNMSMDEAKRFNNFLEGELARASLDNRYWLNYGHTGNFVSWQSGLRHVRKSWHRILYKINCSKR